MTLALLAACTTTAQASFEWDAPPQEKAHYEVKGNPDRFMSMGLRVEDSQVGGDYDFNDFHINDAGHLLWRDYVADVRVPVTGWLTLEFGGIYRETDLGLSILNRNERWTMRGYGLRGGLRVYLK